MNFKAGDYITFNNEQEWKEVLEGLLELGGEVYKSAFSQWDAYAIRWDAYAKTSEGDWLRTRRDNSYKCSNNVTQDFMKFLDNKNQQCDKDLMMKAVIQFEGAWPNNEYCEADEQRIGLCLDSYRHGGVNYETGALYPIGCEATPSLWSIVCTREQFEDFVESLFEGAPDDATHYSPEDENYEQAWWKKDGDEMLCISEEGYIYTWENGWFSAAVKLIPRPVKREPIIGDTPEQLKEDVEPQDMYIPKVGEECEACWFEDCISEWRKVTYKGFYKDLHWFGDYDCDVVTGSDYCSFRPLLTERELFIQQGIADLTGLNPYNSLSEILGKLFDKGYTK